MKPFVAILVTIGVLLGSTGVLAGPCCGDCPEPQACAQPSGCAIGTAAVPSPSIVLGSRPRTQPVPAGTTTAFRSIERDEIWRPPAAAA